MVDHPIGTVAGVRRGRRALLRTLSAMVAGASLFCASGAVHADDYPSAPIRLINPFAPGGSADQLSRLYAAKLSKALDANIIVVNMPGAGGTIGSDRVAKAAPDGYTLLLSNVASQGIAPSLFPSLSYDAVKDFKHIALLGSFPNVLVVGPAVKAQSFAAFIEEAKKTPGGLSFGSAGNGSSPHLSAELLNQRTGINALHVPFKGAAPALVAVMGGEISFQFDNFTTAIGPLQSGRLRALGVTSATRVAALPDVPTMQELGLKDFVVTSWYGWSAPAGTPDHIVAKLADATAAVLQDPEMQEQMRTVGIQAPDLPPAAFAGFVASEVARWREVVEASKARLD